MIYRAEQDLAVLLDNVDKPVQEGSLQHKG